MKSTDNQFNKDEENYSYAENHIALENQMKEMNVVRQYPIGKYFADFYYPDFNVVLEVDGRKYHSQNIDFRHDRIRDKFMLEKGYSIVRATGSMVVKNSSGIVQCLRFIEKNKIYFINSEDDLKAIQLKALWEESQKLFTP